MSGKKLIFCDQPRISVFFFFFFRKVRQIKLLPNKMKWQNLAGEVEKKETLILCVNDI